jgi:hypothetical protein
MPLTRPAMLLRLEGLATLVAAILLYARQDTTWWLFAVLLLAPDLSALGYLFGPSAGAALYNFAHTFVGPLALGAIGVLADHELARALALIWTAHLGMDHAAGYGLKYPSAFKDTHLQRV